MWRTIWVMCLLAVIATDAAAAGKRVALVIGNQAYRLAPLAAPRNDAEAMARALAANGFAVVRIDDADRQQMLAALGEFRRTIADAGAAVFYFAGHGTHAGGRTSMLPVDGEMGQKLIDLRAVMAAMATPRPGMRNLIVLDSCRNDPAMPGGAASEALPPATTLIAARPGERAAEDGRHGLLTAAVLEAIARSGGDAEAMFREVAALRSLRLAQADEEGGAALRYRGILPKDSAEEYEIAFWESIKDSTHASDYEAYLQAYPNGRFVPLAKARLERLRASAGKADSKSESAPAKPPPVRTAPAQPAARVPVPQAASPAAPAKPTAGAAPGGESRDCPTCPIMVSLPGGAFTMGSNNSDLSEKPAHRVAIGQPFAIGKYEVTTEQWEACVAADGCPRVPSMAGAAKNTPARDVSWDDARRYAAWLSKATGKPYRLPTEAEWEYAARGGTSTRYWWGEQMQGGKANCDGCGQPWQAAGPVAAGSFAANPFGLHDVNGSVWEWVGDCWHSSYQGAPADGSLWDAPNCRSRVIRGGSWRDGPTYMPSSTRFKYDAGIRHSQNGFRIARDLK